MVLDAGSMRPAFRCRAHSAGTDHGRQLLLPIASGISVRDPATMRETRTIRYPRAGYDKASHDKAGHDMKPTA